MEMQSVQPVGMSGLELFELTHSRHCGQLDSFISLFKNSKADVTKLLIG